MDGQKQPTLGNGKVCYLEIPAGDSAESAQFYRLVFGWHIREREGHLTFDDGVVEVSGTWVTGRKPSDDTGIQVSIMVSDAVATQKAIIAHGGKVLRPVIEGVPEITASFSDPYGNILSIYQHSFTIGH